MTTQYRLYLFGDQTYDVRRHLKSLLHHRTNPMLEDFLNKSYNALRHEMFALPPQVRDELTRFTSLEDLVLWKQDGRRCVALDMAVTCLYQLGDFIRRTDMEMSYPNQECSRVMGTCTGALCASAISCACTTLQLVPLAVEAVIAAFRTGMHVTDVARRIEISPNSEESWSMVVAGTEAVSTVKAFSEQSTLPLIKRPYISAHSPRSITVSGPPSSLSQLGSCPSFKSFRSTNIPIHGPYHNPLLSSGADIEDIVANLPSELAAYPNQVPVISAAGAAATESDFGSLLRAALSDILLRPISWNGVFEELQAWLGENNPMLVVPFGTHQEQLVYTALQQELSRHAPPLPVGPMDSSKDSAESINPKKDRLAIIAMSGRFPGAKDNEAFWDLLHQGLDVHKPVPALHWDAKTHVNPNGAAKNTSATPFGCWLDDPAAFDARFFNISPREAEQMDPAQRLALMTAYEAIEQAGIVPDATPSTRRDRVGVFYGVTSNDWMETNSAQSIDTYFIPGGNRAFIPGRINYFFKFSGPSYSVDTACSSSLAGIHIACNSLWRGDIDTAIAGGTNVLTNPDMTAGLDRGHFLSRTGNCKTFDDGADGYCRGEGVGTIIIKRLEDALADNDPIQALILGADTNHSAESDSITRPHVGAQQAIFHKILNKAAVTPYDVSYVEMHGTGTQAGDASEMSSVLSVFAPPSNKVKTMRRDDQALYLGSAKSNIGHGEAASGVTSLIKILLMLQKDIIVPHCGIKNKINHKFPTDLQERNVRIAQEPTEWKRNAKGGKPRRVFVNNFSAAGGNTALLIEDAPLTLDVPPTEDKTRSLHLVAVSAMNGVSLQGNLQMLLDYLQRHPQVHLGQLSYTTTARRMHHLHRVMFAAGQTDDLCDQLRTAVKEDMGVKRTKRAIKLVLTFTGNGAQYPGMGRQLLGEFTTFRNEMRRLDQIVKGLGFSSIMPLIESDEQDIGLFPPMVVQLATTCLQIALTRLWASWGIVPTAVVGHSLGEYAALNAAGVISDSDTLFLVGSRARLLEHHCTLGSHCMLVVKGSVDAVSSALKDAKFDIACINSPTETVLAGKNEDILLLEPLLTTAGLKTIRLKVPYAFHSSQMDGMLQPFEELAAGVVFAKPTLPVLCPLNGSVIIEKATVGASYLARHCREPVNMIAALARGSSEKMLTDQTMTLEIGPHPAVAGMMKANLPHVPSAVSLQRGRSNSASLAAALKTLYLAGIDVRWAEYHKDFKASQKVIKLPAYSWDLKDYWMQYVNDWSLRKGDAPLVINAGSVQKLESTTIHRVVEESGDASKTQIVVESNIARKDLSPLVQGHEVDGIPLCTPSVYADIALSLGTYLLDRYRPDKQERLVNVSEMTISKALILREKATEQLLQAHCDVKWEINEAAIKVMSFDTKHKLQLHAQCVVRFQDRSFLKTLQMRASEVKQKMQALRDGIATGETARFNRPMVYRMIRPLARFHDDYRAIDEVVLNSKTLEASSKLSFGSVKMDGQYHTHPAIIDALTQSCGFAMNCNDNTDLDEECFMNHGWSGLRLFEPIDLSKEYTTYTRVHEGANGLWHGDVVIFCGDAVVASLEQVTMQGVPRRVLKVILSIESGAKSQGQRSGQPTKATSTSATSSQMISAGKEQSVLSAASGAVACLKATKALSIIAEESGLDQDEFTDNLVFSDAGVDSLMALTISARFKEDMEIDLDFSTLFSDYPTVKDLKVFFGDSKAKALVVEEAYDTPRRNSTACDTPRTSSVASIFSSGSTGTTSTGATTPGLGADGNFQSALAIIAEESGVPIEEWTEESSFAECGIDSLLSLVIVNRFNDELDMEMPHESLFLECPTLGDLKRMLTGETEGKDPPPSPPGDRKDFAYAPPEPVPEVETPPALPDADTAILTARKNAVNQYLEKYTAGFSGPTADPSRLPLADGEQVVLVTGASGGLGSYLTNHLARLPSVKSVVCLNRLNKIEGHARQAKAMRDKGIRFPEELRHKLQVFQTDSSMPRLGLSRRDYDQLVDCVTHVIHNAWPMSAKRPLEGFESQFQVMRNLVDLASEAASRRPETFKLGFQMVSSIGVVGLYGRGSTSKVMVPEERVDIGSVLPNGYGEAKWGCESMLDLTLHKHPDRFRTMVVRLGQIAGSRNSGYWNPMEHFGFMIKSSQTLNILPSFDSELHWCPVEDIAGTLSDLVMADNVPHPFYHIENPIGQPWRDMTTIIAKALHIPTSNVIPFGSWVERVRAAPQKDNPASTIIDFLEDTFPRMACGGLVLDTKKTLEHSQTLREVAPVTEKIARKYIHIWREIGFLKNTAEDKARFGDERAYLWGP